MPKKFRLLSLILTGAAALSVMTGPAFAQGGESGRPQITVQRRHEYDLYIDGEERGGFWGYEDYEHGESLAYGKTLYVPMKTAGIWMEMDAVWDGAAHTLAFTKSDTDFSVLKPATYYENMPEEIKVVKAYEWDNGAPAELLTDVTVTVNGQARTFFDTEGGQLYPILYHDYPYISVECLGDILNKDIFFWFRPDGGNTTIMIYTQPTQEDFTEFDAYCAEMKRLQEELRTGLDALGRREDLTKETFLEEVWKLRAIGQQMLDLSLPGNQGVFFQTKWVRFYSSYVPEDDCDDILIPGRKTYPYTWQEELEGLLSITESHMDRVDDCIMLAQEQAAAVAQAAGVPKWTAATEAVREKAERERWQLETATRFTDAAQIKNWDAVAMLAALNVFTGKDDGSFDPAAPVTRAEMAKLICAMLWNGKIPKSVCRMASDPRVFGDTVGHWAEPYISDCAMREIITGRGDGSFDPNATVTVAEAAKMALILLGNYSSDFGLTGARWKENTLTIAGQKKLLANIDALPDAPMTRDDAAQLLYNTLYAKRTVRGENGYYEDDFSYIQSSFDSARIPAAIPDQPK